VSTRCTAWLDGVLSDAASLHLPPAAWLPLAELGPVLAARVSAQKRAGIEPVYGARVVEDRGHRAAEIGGIGTAVVPESFFSRRRLEAEDLLHAAVAVRRDDQHRPGQAAPRLDPEEQVVVELATLPVIEKLVPSEVDPQIGEKSSQAEILRNRLGISSTTWRTRYFLAPIANSPS